MSALVFTLVLPNFIFGIARFATMFFKLDAFTNYIVCLTISSFVHGCLATFLLFNDSDADNSIFRNYELTLSHDWDRGRSSTGTTQQSRYIDRSSSATRESRGSDLSPDHVIELIRSQHKVDLEGAAGYTRYHNDDGDIDENVDRHGDEDEDEDDDGFSIEFRSEGSASELFRERGSTISSITTGADDVSVSAALAVDKQTNMFSSIKRMFLA